MKSLNRTLSLVLVLAMVLGLMGFASAKTSFTDDATIQYQTAVGTMVGMGAINGYTDGTFKPTGTITREEAAKMVTYAVLGADVAKTLSVSSTGFTDVASTRWSAPFITYLVSKGIVNGLGDGTFNPTGNVTGFELAKMLLCAAGYGKQGEYTGASWSLNVAVDAYSKGIFTGSKAASYSAAATREEAALYCFNAITKIDVVKYSKDSASYSAVSTGVTIAVSTYHYATTTPATVTGVSYNALKGTTYATAVTADTTPITYTFPADFSAVGSRVILHRNTSDGTIYYVQTITKTLDVSNMSASAYKAAVYTSGLAAVSTAPFKEYHNFYQGGNYTLPSSGSNTYGLDIKLITYTDSTTGVTTIVGAQTRTRTVDAVSSVSAISGSESLTFAALGLTKSTATASKVVFGDTVVKGDVVMLTSVNSGTYYIVEKVKSVTGVASSYGYDTAVGANFMTVGGTNYFASTSNTASITNFISAAGIPTTPGYSYDLFLDNFGDVIGYTGTTTASTAYVLSYVPKIAELETVGAFGSTYAYWAQVMFADGTYGAYQISTFNGKTIIHSGTPTSSQIIYTDVVTNTGAFYNATLDTATNKVAMYSLAVYGATFTPALANSTAATQVITNNAVLGNGIYATANTTYFYTAGTFGASNFVFYAFKGYASAPTIASGFTELDTAYYTATDYNKYAAAVAFTGVPTASTSADVYYYNGDYSTSVSPTATTINYTLYKSGVAETYTVTTTNSVNPTLETSAGFYIKKAVVSGATTGLATPPAVTYATNKYLANFASNTLSTVDNIYFATAYVNVVDLRTPSELTASAALGVGTVSSPAALLAAKAAGVTLKLAVQYTTASGTLTGSASAPFIATYIYVTASSASYTLTFSPNLTATAAATAGSTKTLTVAASSTAGSTVTYQWYTSIDGGTTYSPISGATSASYAAPAHADGESATYRCVASAPGSTSITSTACLVSWAT
ncbi:MAG: S-layer homology domain-containing protein [Clostridia bacterium]|nr:S-layer homology domain-containing protein [Clostridia bacterium]